MCFDVLACNEQRMKRFFLSFTEMLLPKEKEKGKGKEKVVYTARGGQDGKNKAADKLSPPLIPGPKAADKPNPDIYITDEYLFPAVSGARGSTSGGYMGAGVGKWPNIY
jgi:hypothetical protein